MSGEAKATIFAAIIAAVATIIAALIGLYAATLQAQNTSLREENTGLQEQNVELEEQNEALIAQQEVVKTEQRNELVKRAENYAQEGNYPMALRIIEESLRNFSNDAVLLKKLEEYRTAYHTEIRLKAIADAKAETLVDNYVNAISILQSAIDIVGNDVELISLKNSYADTYKSKLFAEAKNAYYTSGYLAAIDVLEKSTAVIGTDNDVSLLIQQYKDCAPVSYYDLLASSYYHDGKTQSAYYWRESDYDTNKNVVNNIIYQISSHSTWTTPDGYKTRFFINKEFKLMSGTLYYSLEWKNSASGNGYIRIYGDSELICDKKITSQEGSIDFQVDLTDVIYLTVIMYTGSENIVTGGRSIFAGVSNFNLYRNVME